MITVNTMFDIYSIDINKNIDNTEKELKELKVVLDSIIDYFKEKFIEVSNIINLKPIEPALSSEEKYYNIQLRDYLILKDKYDKRLELYNIYNNKKINFKLYKFILKRFNTLLIDELVYNSYKFYDLFLGNISIITTNNNKKRVPNWVKSKENKQKLLDNNEIPFIKKDYEEAIKNNIEYKGIKWIEYLEGISLFFKWELSSTQYVRLSNLRDYTFVPYNGKNSSVRKLNDLKKIYTDEELIEKFKKI